MKKKSKKKLLFAVDGNAYVHRALHSMPPMNNSHGEPTSVVKGFLNIVCAEYDKVKPDMFCIVFDDEGKNFRHALYPEYKLKDEDNHHDESMYQQIDVLQELFLALGVVVLRIKGVEADDTLATLATRAELAGHRVLVGSGDKDLCQFVTKNIRLLDTRSNQGMVMKPSTVKSRYGVRPDQVIEWLMLMGDTSDNIPGVYKCGKKTAADLLNKYGSIKAIMKDVKSLTPKLKENMIKASSLFALTRKLTTVKRDVDLGMTLSDDALAFKPADTKKVVKILNHLEFVHYPVFVKRRLGQSMTKGRLF